MKHKLFGKLALSAALLGTAPSPYMHQELTQVMYQNNQAKAHLYKPPLPSPFCRTRWNWQRDMHRKRYRIGKKRLRSTASLPEPRNLLLLGGALSMETTVMHIRLREMANSELQLP